MGRVLTPLPPKRKPAAISGRGLNFNRLQTTYAAAVSGFLYVRRTGLTTMPMRIALAETLMRPILPFTTARTFWIFGLNFRAVIPVVLVPTPPRYLALPRWVFWFPKVVFF